MLTVQVVENTKGSSEVEKDESIYQSKRRNLGRKARRRRKTAAAIEAAVAAYASGDTNTVPPITIIPTDRNLEWPAVKEICSLEDEDRKSLVAQLGFCPGNAISVAARVNDAFPYGKWKDDTTPLVLKLYPLVYRNESDGTKHRRKRKGQLKNELLLVEESQQSEPLVEPFPTTFWVTHPRFKTLISKIELLNRGTHYEQKLQDDPNALDSMKYAHLAYGEERQSMITSDDRDFIQKRHWESAIDVSRGVAGIRNPAAVKCLHAHAAHFWSGCNENIVGKWVAEEVIGLLEEKEGDPNNASSDTNE